MASASRTRPNLQPNVELGFYCRIAKLLLSVGTHTLRQQLVHIVGDVGAFIRDEQVIKKLKAAKCFSAYQWKIIATADVDEFDITLLSALLLNVCNLSDGHKKYIRDIRQHRNDLCHSHDACITKAGFDTKWKNVSDTLCNIAQLCCPAFRDEIEKEITDLKSAPIDVSRDQHHFQVLLEHCLIERDFQHGILTQQTEANTKLQQLINHLSLLEKRQEARQTIQILKEVNDVMIKCVQSNEDKSAICSLLMEDMNGIIDNHLSSLQKGIQAELQSISKSVAGATDLIQENGQDLKRMEMKLDKLSQNKPVVNLIDDAFLDMVADGIKKFPGKIVQKLTPKIRLEDKDVTKPNIKADEKKKSELKEEYLKQHSHDEQIKYHTIALEVQNQYLTSAMLEFSRTSSKNTVDSTNVNNETTSGQDTEMGEEYRAELEKSVELDLARGVGPDTVLLLDASCNMKRDGNFANMMTLTRQIIQGIFEESVPEVLEENIAIVTFGRLTTIRQHLTNDQYNWMTCLEGIENSGPDGPADLCKGIRMCEAAIQVNKKTLQKHGLRISPRVILITDGNISDPSDPSESFQNRENARQQAYRLMDALARNNHKVFCVPLCGHGSPSYKFLEKLAHRASGSVIRPDEKQYITRYHRKIFWALLFESHHPGIQVSESSYIADILKQSKLPFTDEEVEDMEEIIANPDVLGYARSSPKIGRYTDPHDDLPPLGTRVVQGKHWREDEFKEHHCGPGTGTVIGQDDESVWVEWDGCEDDTHYKYKYGLNKFFEVRVHDRPRTPEEGKAFLVGCCVTKWNEEEEQEGLLGYGLVFITSPRFKTFGVRWKNGAVMYHEYSSDFYAHEEFPSPWCFGPEHM
ncbi:uncharacterized protein LOC110457933 isoform X2 [Mizuhopecten yessoensis]|uniref:uncharacterized protein LOC110457933 isoform X2 n=1 Tax=Mizuhopecten yessoensis TaxID=6573 RepID=UPI000B45E06F|nr:uncharacterized protein LOC110457933 isoform X2 [Mizuhopecten yessoensis]